MNRKEFLSHCGQACIGGMVLSSAFLQGCHSSKIVAGAMTGFGLTVPASEFEFLKKDNIQYRNVIIIQHDQLEYPIALYRSDAVSYTALWMRCTHQGTELQAFGEKLHCPAHGSEFNRAGGVENGPASSSLRTFPVTVADGQLNISLK